MQSKVDKIEAKLSSPCSLVASLDDRQLKPVRKTKLQSHAILNHKLTGYKVLVNFLLVTERSCWRRPSGPSVREF